MWTTIRPWQIRSESQGRLKSGGYQTGLQKLHSHLDVFAVPVVKISSVRMKTLVRGTAAPSHRVQNNKSLMVTNQALEDGSDARYCRALRPESSCINSISAHGRQGLHTRSSDPTRSDHTTDHGRPPGPFQTRLVEFVAPELTLEMARSAACITLNHPREIWLAINFILTEDAHVVAFINIGRRHISRL